MRGRHPLGPHPPNSVSPCQSCARSHLAPLCTKSVRAPSERGCVRQGNRILMEAVPRRGETLFCVPEIRCQTTKTRSLRHRRHIGTGQMKCKQPAQGSIKLECDCPGVSGRIAESGQKRCRRRLGKFLDVGRWPGTGKKGGAGSRGCGGRPPGRRRRWARSWHTRRLGGDAGDAPGVGGGRPG